jgi:hypothetical protein
MRTVLSRIYDFCEFRWKNEPYFSYGRKTVHFIAYIEPYDILGEHKLTYLHINLLTLRLKHSPQPPILKNPHPTFLPQCERPSFTLMKKQQTQL